MKKQDITHITAWLLLTLLLFASHALEAQTRSLSLKEAIQMAREQNRLLKADSLNINRSQQQVRVAKSALLPSVSVSGDLQHYFQKPVFFGLSGNGTSSTNDVGYGRIGGEDQATAQVTLLQPIYNPTAYPEVKRGKLLEQQSKLKYIDKEIDVVSQVKQIYLRILVLEKRLQLQKESIVRNQKALEDSRSLLAQGRALRVDTLRAYTSLKNLEPDLLRLTYAIDLSKQQLSVLSGDQSLNNFSLKDSLVFDPTSTTPNEDSTYATSLAQRPDLNILSLNKTIYDKQISIAKAAVLPTVNFISQYQVQTQTNSFRYDNSHWPPVFFAGAHVSIPLFTGMANSAKIKQAKIERRQADIVYENAKEQHRVEVKQVTANIAETAKRIHTQRNVSETAELSYSITKYRYGHGVASRLELIDAELALTTARSNYLEAVYGYMSARIELDRTLGKIADQL